MDIEGFLKNSADTLVAIKREVRCFRQESVGFFIFSPRLPRDINSRRFGRIEAPILLRQTFHSLFNCGHSGALNYTWRLDQQTMGRSVADILSFSACNAAIIAFSPAGSFGNSERSAGMVIDSINTATSAEAFKPQQVFVGRQHRVEKCRLGHEEVCLHRFA